MPKTKISEFDLTPANNTDLDGIDIGEGCAPSGINNAIRELMSQLKDFQGGTSGDRLAIAAGGTNAATTTAALQNLGGTTTGINLFKAVSSTVARTELGATTVGNDVFTAASASAARTAIGAGTGDVTTTGTQTLTNKTITGLKETRVTMSANDIDLNAGNYFTKTISTTTTFTVSNVASSGTSNAFILDLTNGGAASITWFSGVKWVAGTAPTLTASGRDALGFFTHDGGTTWTGLVLGLDVK